MPATVTLSSVGLAAAGEGVAAAALEAAAGGPCRWRVRPPPGWCGNLRHDDAGQATTAAPHTATVLCASASEAVRLVLASDSHNTDDRLLASSSSSTVSDDVHYIDIDANLVQNDAATAAGSEAAGAHQQPP